MPRAANATTLRRNQACKQCRKRKLKCDAQRPHCGTCQKQWAAQIAVPPPVGFAHPSEPTCTYDPIEGLVLAPDTVEDPNERVRLLEAQINQLQSKLVAAQQESDPTRAVSADPADHHQHQHQHQHHQHQHQHQHHQQQYHQSLSSSSRPYKSTSPPSANAPPPSASTSGSGLSPNGFSSSNLYTHPPQDSLHLGYAAGPSRNVPGPTLPPLNSLSSKEGGYVDNNNNSAGSSGGSGGGGYYATGLHSDVRSTSYPSVSDEVPADRSHGRTSSHPYHRDQPHISSLAKAERANSQYHASSHAHVRSTSDMDDPFTGVNDMNILSVSKLGRQTDHRSRGYSITNQPSPPFYDIMFSGWSRDLPPRQELISYIELFFRCDPCSSRMLHRPTLLNNLNYPPTHPDFPHPALLHAICATASRYTFRGRLDASLNASLSAQQQLQPPPRDKFAEFHANKTRAYVNATMSNGQNIFDVWQACIILSWWFYSEGRWVEVWIQAGFQTRAVIPLGLNYLGLIKRGPDGQAVKNPYLAPPKSHLETETRKRAWWMSILFDRIVSVGGWLHSVDERDIGTELPLSYAHYEAMIDMPPNPQTLHSDSVYTRHPFEYTDSYLLFLKGVMLFGRITDYAVRMGIRAPLLAHGQQGTYGHDGQSPLNPHHLSPNATNTTFNLGGSTNAHTPTPGVGAGGGGGIRSPSPGGSGTAGAGGPTDPRNAPGFQALDRLVSSDFLNSFPQPFRSCLGAAAPGGGGGGGGGGPGFDGAGMEHGFGVYPGGIDTDLYVAHLVPHAATITLHSPWVNYADPTHCPSVARCMEAARAILDKYYLLTSTSFDITLLHPFVTICWYLAAVVEIHLCKRLIETGDLVGEATCWGEINMLRNALVTYGNCSPIGTRQEKLLHPIMKEIIDMTTQSQPLLVGLPLYPFSLDSAFQRTERQAAAAAAAAGGSGSGSLMHAGHVSGIGALLNAPSEEVDVDDAVAPIPDISFGDDADIVMGGMDSHQANQQHAASIAVPSVQSLGTGWTMMTDGK